MKKYRSVLCSVTIISRNLTLENSYSGERRRRNHYIPWPSYFKKMAVAGPGGPPGSAAGPLSHAGGGPVIFQRGPRCNAVRPLRQNKSGQKAAHFGGKRRNTQWLREKKMHAQNSRICARMILIFEFFKDFEAFVGIIPSF